MASRYNQYSPYAKVKQTWYLGHNLPAPMVHADSDTFYTIPSVYDEQPWRLSKELYGEERLYYIFSLLNPDDLADPIYDFKAGLTIRVPSIVRVQNYMSGTRNVK